MLLLLPGFIPLGLPIHAQIDAKSRRSRIKLNGRPMLDNAADRGFCLPVGLLSAQLYTSKKDHNQHKQWENTKKHIQS